MSDVKAYINQLWSSAVADWSWLLDRLGFGSALWLTLLFWLVGGVLELTTLGTYYYSFALFGGAVILIFVIAPYKIWQKQNAQLIALKGAQSNERISFLDLAKWASKLHGWRFEEDNIDGLAFGWGLRHAARDGDVVIEGQRERNYWSEYDRVSEPFDPIPKDDWSTCEISIPLVNELMQSNHDVKLVCETALGRRVTHRNLRISENFAKTWFETCGPTWRKKVLDACQRDDERTKRILAEEQHEDPK